MGFQINKIGDSHAPDRDQVKRAKKRILKEKRLILVLKRVIRRKGRVKSERKRGNK